MIEVPTTEEMIGIIGGTETVDKQKEMSVASAKNLAARYGFDPEDEAIVYMIGMMGAKLARDATDLASQCGARPGKAGVSLMRAALCQAENAMDRACVVMCENAEKLGIPDLGDDPLAPHAREIASRMKVFESG